MEGAEELSMELVSKTSYLKGTVVPNSHRKYREFKMAETTEDADYSQPRKNSTLKDVVYMLFSMIENNS